MDGIGGDGPPRIDYGPQDDSGSSGSVRDALWYLLVPSALFVVFAAAFSVL